MRVALGLCLCALAPSAALADGQWSGVYIGGSIGAGVASATVGSEESSLIEETSWGSSSGGGSFTSSRYDYFSEYFMRAAGSETGSAGPVGGAQIGAATQFGRVVLGAEVGLQWSDLSARVFSAADSTLFTRNVSSHSTNGGPYVEAGRTETTDSQRYNMALDASLDWQLSVVGRVGYEISDGLLIYGLGGLTRGGFTIEGSPQIDADASNGYVVGVGGEMAVGNNWFLKVEYRYADFDALTMKKKTASSQEDLSSMPVVGWQSYSTFSQASQLDIDSHDLRIGASYRFWAWK